MLWVILQIFCFNFHKNLIASQIQKFWYFSDYVRHAGNHKLKNVNSRKIHAPKLDFCIKKKCMT